MRGQGGGRLGQWQVGPDYVTGGGLEIFLDLHHGHGGGHARTLLGRRVERMRGAILDRLLIDE